MATWGPEPGGQGSDLMPQAVLFRDAANSWFEAGALSGRGLQNLGGRKGGRLICGGCGPSTCPSGAWAPLSGTHHLPQKASESGAGEQGSGVYGLLPRTPGASGPLWARTSAGQGGLSAGLDSLQNPRGSRGKAS